MAEADFTYEQVEAFRDTLTTNLSTLFDPVAEGQEGSFTVDTFSLRLTDETTATLSAENKTMLRKELYELLGIPFTEVTEPYATYKVPSEPEEISVKVFAGDYVQGADRTNPVYLHEAHYGDGDIGWIVSSSSEPPGELVRTGEGDKSDPNEPRFEDPSPIEVAEKPGTLEYALVIVNKIKESFPEYSVLIDSFFKKGGRICLHKEEADEDGRIAAINILTTLTAYKYNIGFIEMDGKKKPVFKNMNLPKCVETVQPNGSITLEYPAMEWGFEAKDEKKKERSFTEMMAMLTLLRQKDIF